jgi:hypothetical protein
VCFTPLKNFYAFFIAHKSGKNQVNSEKNPLPSAIFVVAALRSRGSSPGGAEFEPSAVSA